MRLEPTARAVAMEGCSVDEAIAGRRSVRRYSPRDVDPRLVHEVIDLARRAPTSMDGQACHFVVVRSRGTLERLAECKRRYCPPDKRDYPCDFLRDAPVLVVICAERERSFQRGIENAVLAGAFLLLAAGSRGLGSVFLTAYQPDAPGLAADVRDLLALPEGLDPVCMVPLGFPDPDEPVREKSLRPLQEIVHDEQFRRELQRGDRSAP